MPSDCTDSDYSVISSTFLNSIASSSLGWYRDFFSESDKPDVSLMKN